MSAFTIKTRRVPQRRGVGVMVGVAVTVGVTPVQLNVQLSMSCRSVICPVRAPKPTVAGENWARFRPVACVTKIESMYTTTDVPVALTLTVCTAPFFIKMPKVSRLACATTLPR